MEHDTLSHGVRALFQRESSRLELNLNQEALLVLCGCSAVGLAARLHLAGTPPLKDGALS